MKIKYYKYAYQSNYIKYNNLSENFWKKIYLPLPFDEAKKFMILWHESVRYTLEDFILLEESTSVAELKVLSYYENHPDEAMEWPIGLIDIRIISYTRVFHYLNYIKKFINN